MSREVLTAAPVPLDNERYGQSLAMLDPASKVPVVLLHSSLSSKAQWGRLGATLDPDFQVVAIDLYGYGERAMPDCRTDFSLQHEVDEVLRQIEQRIGKRSFHLVGHSYGGAIALRLAAEQEQRVRSLALYEPVAFFLLDDDLRRQEVTRLTAAIERWIEVDPCEATRLFIDFWNGPGAYLRLPPSLRDEFVRRIAKVRLDFQALFAERMRLPDLASLGLPVCLMSGLRSPAAARRIAQHLAATLPNADSHYFDAGHMAPVTHAGQVNPVIAAFVGAGGHGAGRRV